MYNKVVMMGRITHELEVKTTPSGVQVCQFSIAVDRRFQTKGEEKKTDFFRVTAWRTAADFVGRYFKKGSMILVEGELQNNNYTDKNGNTVYSVVINAERLSFTGEKAANTSGNAPQASGYSEPNGNADSADDTYPF